MFHFSPLWSHDPFDVLSSAGASLPPLLPSSVQFPVDIFLLIMVRWPSWHRFTFLTPPKKSDSAGKKKNTNHKNLHMVSCFKDGDPEKQRKANMMRKLLTPNPQNPWNIMCRASSLLKPEYFFLIFGRFFASAFAATFSSAWQSHTVTHHCTRKMRCSKYQEIKGWLDTFEPIGIPRCQNIKQYNYT